MKKAEILYVGTINPDTGEPNNDWIFDCKMTVPAIEILSDGTILYAGYTVAELQDEREKFLKHLIEQARANLRQNNN